MDLASASRRERVGGELADLFVGEGVVGGRVLRLLDEQTRRHRGRHQVAERHQVAIGRALIDPQANLPQILQAEVPPHQRRFGECGLRLQGEVRRPALDQGADGRGRQPFGIAPERPPLVRLLQHPRLAVGAGDLFDDERDPFCLAVDRGRGRGVDLSSEDLLEELRGLHDGEPRELQPPDHAHPFHVGDQRHRLRERGELLRPDREHHEDRARPLGPDDVPEETQAVLVRPLHVVDQQRERLFGRECTDGHGREVERAEQPLVGGHACERGVVTAAERRARREDRLLRRGAAHRLDHLRRADDRPRQEERAAELLVRSHRDREEPAGLGALPRRQEEPCLPDPGLALDGQGAQPSAFGDADRVLDRGELGRSPHHGAAGAMLEETQRGERGRGDRRRVDHERPSRRRRSCSFIRRLSGAEGVPAMLGPPESIGGDPASSASGGMP